MKRKFALILVTSIIATSAATSAWQLAHAAGAIKLQIHNSAKVGIQIFVQDFIGKSHDEQNKVVQPGGGTGSNAISDAKGNVDFYIQVRFIDETKGSYYRCLPVQTDVKGRSELKYDVTKSFGKAVGGAGVGCKL